MTPEVAAIIAASISAVAAIISALFSGHNSGKLNTIHVLVNANFKRVEQALLKALQRISELEVEAERGRTDARNRRRKLK